MSQTVSFVWCTCKLLCFGDVFILFFIFKYAILFEIVFFLIFLSICYWCNMNTYNEIKIKKKYCTHQTDRKLNLDLTVCAYFFLQIELFKAFFVVSVLFPSVTYELLYVLFLVQSNCSSIGGYLLEIESSTENRWLSQRMYFFYYNQGNYDVTSLSLCLSVSLLKLNSNLKYRSFKEHVIMLKVAPACLFQVHGDLGGRGVMTWPRRGSISGGPQAGTSCTQTG